MENLTHLDRAVPPSATASPSAGEVEVSEHHAQVDGIRIRYLRAGRGPALLLVHGLLGYAFSWRHNMTELARHATVYAIDLPGAGFSARGKFDCSLRGLATLLLHFMDTVGIESADIVGTSHGGAVAIMMAALDAEGFAHDSASSLNSNSPTGKVPSASPRIHRLVLVAPISPWAWGRQWLIASLATRPGALTALALSPVLRATRGYFIRRIYGDPARMSPGTIEGYAAALAVPGSIRQILRMVRSWRADVSELEAVLPRIAHIPTLLLWGSRDTVIAPASAATVAQHLGNCDIVTLQGAGHLPYEELPGEFNAAVIQFLLRTGPET